MRVGGAARSVWFNFVGRDFFNALAEKDEPLFKLMLVKYLVSFVAGIPVFVWADYLQVTPRHIHTCRPDNSCQLLSSHRARGGGRGVCVQTGSTPVTQVQVSVCSCVFRPIDRHCLPYRHSIVFFLVVPRSSSTRTWCLHHVALPCWSCCCCVAPSCGAV